MILNTNEKIKKVTAIYSTSHISEFAFHSYVYCQGVLKKAELWDLNSELQEKKSKLWDTVIFVTGLSLNLALFVFFLNKKILITFYNYDF